jgi:hypothetical protein
MLDVGKVGDVHVDEARDEPLAAPEMELHARGR